MTRSALLGVLAALALSIPRSSSADPYLESEPSEFALEGATRFRTEFPVGKFTLEGDDGKTMRVLIRIDCKEHGTDDCQREAKRIRIDHHVSGNQLTLEFEGIKKEIGTPRISVEAHVLVPRTMIAKIEMGVGELHALGMTSDLDLQLGVGELTVKGQRRDYRTAEAESGVGDAAIHAGDDDIHERGFIGHSAHWNDGRGHGLLRASVGVGESTVTLR